MKNHSFMTVVESENVLVSFVLVLLIAHTNVRSLFVKIFRALDVITLGIEPKIFILNFNLFKNFFHKLK
jgi:hypothetical protein